MPTQHGSDNVTSGIVDFMVKFRELSTYDSSSMLNSFLSTDCISRPCAELISRLTEFVRTVIDYHRQSHGLAEIRREIVNIYEKYTASTSLLRSVPNTYRLIDRKFFKRALFEGGFEMKVAKWLVVKKMFCSCAGNTIFQDRQYMKS